MYKIFLLPLRKISGFVFETLFSDYKVNTFIYIKKAITEIFS